MTTGSAARPAALVTGGAHRLGREIALALAEHGHDIALHYGSSRAAATETALLIQERNVECEVIEADLAEVETAGTLVRAASERFPRLRVLVNNAARYDQVSLLNTSAEVFDALMAVNLRAPFFLIQAFARLVGEGDVINIIDNKIAFNQPAYGAYLLAKKALAELTRLAALELSPHIRVNGIAPGVVLPSEMRSAEYLAWRADGIPLRRQGDASDITRTVVYLLENRFVTGQVLFVDGGESIAQVGRHAANAPRS